MRIHHATAKKAASLGIEITEKGEGFVLTYEGQALAVNDVKAGVAQIAAWIESDGEGDEPEWVDSNEDENEEGDEEEENEGKSVVKKKYKKAYRPFKQKCGDELSKLITTHLTVKDDETGEMKIDETKLKEFAKLNDCWIDSYAHLNVGMRRMNVRNRLAAKLRHDHKTVWN